MKTLRKSWAAITAVIAVSAAVIVVTLTTLADAPQPVLRITGFGSNYFNVGITNGVSTTNYTLYWTPALANPSYPWQVLSIGGTGETNFLINGGEWNIGFFKALLGSDFDSDGVPEWQDAQPMNPNVGILRVTIDSPTSGFNFN